MTDEKQTRMTDLKMIDELFTLESIGRSGLEEVMRSSSLHYRAALRLYHAWETKEMPLITLSLAEWFKNWPEQRRREAMEYGQRAAEDK